METGLAIPSKALVSAASDHNLFWQEASLKLIEEFGDATYRSWISHLKFQELRDNILTLAVPTKFIKEWIQINYLKIINDTITSLDPLIKKIDLVLGASNNITSNKEVADDKTITYSSNKSSIKEESCEITSNNLDPRFVFDNFVVGLSNRVAFNSAKAIAQGYGASVSSNILYIKAPVGMGKTHLIQSIAAFTKAEYPNKKIAYMSAEKFMHLYIKSIKNNNLVAFKETLRSLELLLLDDLQFICGKNATQQEFINTLNALTEANKQIVLASDTSPYALNLDQRSVSRLAGGLVVDIKPSDYELRKEILRSKSILYNTSIPEDVIDLLAQKIDSTNRDLEGALKKIIAYCSLEQSEINTNIVLDILKDNIDAHIKHTTIEDVLNKVAAFYNVKITEITSKSRAAQFVKPRQVAAYLAKKLTSKSLQDIGFALGGRDHATVIYSIKKLESSFATDKRTLEEIKSIEHSF